MTLNPKILVFSDFSAIFGCKKVNCDEMDRYRPRLLANRNCYKLSRVSWALAQISCFFTPHRFYFSNLGLYRVLLIAWDVTMKHIFQKK